ncbi:MAG: hypothetical protein HOY78_00230 [Saccharothrix sp.]|nr:hypothetical protein [Saccharothrix sp.]
MNEAELVDLLHERADIPDDGHRTRVEGVRAKVRRSRWQQAGATLAAIAVVLAGLLYGVPRGQSSDPADPPGEPLPTYQDGYRFTTEAFTALPERAVRLSYTVTGDFMIYARCGISGRRSTMVITINDKRWFEGGCDEIGTPVPPPPDAWTAFGIEAGQPARIEASLTDAPGGAGRWGIRIGEAVPFAEYSFPPRPSRLPELPAAVPGSTPAQADPDHPDRRVEVRVPWSGDALELRANTPGRYRVLVDGVAVVDSTFWTFGAHSATSAPVSEWPELYGVSVVPGQDLTLTVVPERASGQWQVTLLPDPPR